MSLFHEVDGVGMAEQVVMDSFLEADFGGIAFQHEVGGLPGPYLLED